MLTKYYLKKIISIILVSSILLTMLPFNTASSISQSEDLSTEYNSFSLMDEGGITFTPAIDPNIRVSFEVEESVANYESNEIVKVTFKLNKAIEHEVSFDYMIYTGSASNKHYVADSEQGTISFSPGESVKELDLGISKLVNKPIEYGQPSEPWEFWTGDRVFFINCRNIINALFENESESMIIPIRMKNLFNLSESYENATNTNLLDLSSLDSEESLTVTDTVYKKTVETSIKSGDIRTMIDTGVFTHVNMPSGYFLNSDPDLIGSIRFFIESVVWDSPHEVFTTSIYIEGEERKEFTLLNTEESNVLPIDMLGLGNHMEGNGIVKSLNIGFDYTEVSQILDTHLNEPMNFVDMQAPHVIEVAIQNDEFHFGEHVPIVVKYNEPVLVDDISIVANGIELLPVERKGTISESVTFLYEINKSYNGIIEIANIIGAKDLSEKSQEEASEYILYDASLIEFGADITRRFSYLADTTVNTTLNIKDDYSLDINGEIIMSLEENYELANWISNNKDAETGYSTVVKARAIGQDNRIIDVPLYVNDSITELIGRFVAPANLTEEDYEYIVEIYLDHNNSGEFELIYALSEKCVISPIVYIDDEADLEILYANWPPTNKIPADSDKEISLGYRIKNNATWQKPNDFMWTSSDPTIANITSNGAIALTGKPGTVSFTLTALNGGLPDKQLSVSSKTLEIVRADSSFLNISVGTGNIEIFKGDSAKVYYSTNLTELNNQFQGEGTVTTYSYDLYEAAYIDSKLVKGELKLSDKIEATVDSRTNYYVIDENYLLNTSPRGEYGYILEISAEDMLTGEILYAQANICVKALPARAVLRKPNDYFMIDENTQFSIEFSVDNLEEDTEILLNVLKNESTEPVYSTEDVSDIGSKLSIDIEPVEKNKLLDVYTISFSVKNPFDEGYSYDSYTLYVYNSQAFKILVNGILKDELEMSMDEELSELSSQDIIALNRKVSLTDYISINNKEHKWSSYADKIKWEVGDEDIISLKYNNNGIYASVNPDISFSPESSFILEGVSSGSSYIKATHIATGMEVILPVIVEEIRDKLFVFQVYPQQQAIIEYKNGENQTKEASTDSSGRAGIYEKSSIISDVTIKPYNSKSYKKQILTNSQLLANQAGNNESLLYPINNIALSKVDYTLKFTIAGDFGEYGNFTYYQGNIFIRGGVYRNGVYCPGAKINGKSGKETQIVEFKDRSYTLTFDPSEFITHIDNTPVTADDKIEYIIEISYPDNLCFPTLIKADVENISYGSQYMSVIAEMMESSKIKNNVSVLSKSIVLDNEIQTDSNIISFYRMPESSKFTVEFAFKGDPKKAYGIHLYDEHGYWRELTNNIEQLSYEFTDNIVLKGTFDLNRFISAYNDTYLKPGEKINLYANIMSYDYDKSLMVDEIIQSEPVFTLQKMIGIPEVNSLLGTEIKELSKEINSMADGPDAVSLSGKDDKNGIVKKSLDYLSQYSLNKESVVLELYPTDDPLVYEGIIKFYYGELSGKNPSGVKVVEGVGVEKKMLLQAAKHASKGEFLIWASREANKHLKGSKNFYKTYGGGFLIEGEIYYDIDDEKWKTLPLNTRVDLGTGGGYTMKFNTWLGPVPVTTEFRTGITVQVGTNIKSTKIYLDDDEKEFDIAKEYIYNLRPYIDIYAFGGIGVDAEIASLKVGPYGVLALDQDYLWYRGETGKSNGQKITLSGETGVRLSGSIVGIEYSKHFKLAGFSQPWKFNDYDDINAIYRPSKGRSFNASESLDDYDSIVLIPIRESAAIEDRSYLDAFERKWYPNSASRVALFLVDDISIVEENSYPFSNPVVTDDGELMAYVSDMGNADTNDTVMLLSRKNDSGEYSEGIEVDESGYRDSDVAIDGNKTSGAIAWTRLYTHIGKKPGEEVTNEDLLNILTSTETMASFYNEDKFITKRLTENTIVDIAPVVASNGERAIVAWRSVYTDEIEDELDFSGRDSIVYSIFDGEIWSEEQVLYDGSTDSVKALNIAMLSDGSSAIVYQINAADTENTEIICAVLDANGEILSNTRLTNNEVEDWNPQITNILFPDEDEIERFIIGWNSETIVDEIAEDSVIRLAVMNNNGSLYNEYNTEIENTYPISNYNSFQFTKGAKNLEDLSIVWSEPNQEAEDGSGDLLSYSIFGKKLLQSSDGGIKVSPKIKLLDLDSNNVIDFFDSYMDTDTEEINFVMLLSEYGNEGVMSKIATANSSYKNNLEVDEVTFSREEILPGLDMPIMFTLYNDGIEPIKEVIIDLEGKTNDFDETINPGEYKTYIISYTVPEIIINPNYNITAQFEDSKDEKDGSINLNIPDVGIGRIDTIFEKGRQRIFSLQLYNNTFSKLAAGKHKVILNVYDSLDYSGLPLVTEVISDTDSLARINDGKFRQNIILTEEFLQMFLDDTGEIPRDGARIYFSVELEEDGEIVEDAFMSNNYNYVKIQSLIDKRGKAISFAAAIDREGNDTTVSVEAFNNSLKEINNGNIIVRLKDEKGEIVDTKQTYNTVGAIKLNGEEAYYEVFHFSKLGTTVETIFSTIGVNSSLLSELKFKGIPFNFNKEVFEYNIEVTELKGTQITVAVENPESEIVIFKDGKEIEPTTSIPLLYGRNTFKIVVQTGIEQVIYSIIIQNKHKEDNGDNTGEEDAYDSSDDKDKEKDKESTIEYKNPFKDVSKSDWYYEAVKFVNENGLMVGISEDEFGPNNHTTRAMFVTVLYRMMNEPKVNNINYFADIESSAYYTEAVAWAHKNEIVKGVSNTEFGPNISITREQLVTILYRYVTYMEHITDTTADISRYEDSSLVSDYAIPAMRWAVGTGLIKGRSEREIVPQGYATRAEVAAIFQRLLLGRNNAEENKN